MIKNPGENKNIQMEIADKKLQEAIESVHPVALFLFCIINPKFIKYIPRQQPKPEVLYSSP